MTPHINAQAGAFAKTVLLPSHLELAQRFARPTTPKIAPTAWLAISHPPPFPRALKRATVPIVLSFSVVACVGPCFVILGSISCLSAIWCDAVLVIDSYCPEKLTLLFGTVACASATPAVIVDGVYVSPRTLCCPTASMSTPTSHPRTGVRSAATRVSCRCLNPAK